MYFTTDNIYTLFLWTNNLNNDIWCVGTACIEIMNGGTPCWRVHLMTNLSSAFKDRMFTMVSDNTSHLSRRIISIRFKYETDGQGMEDIRVMIMARGSTTDHPFQQGCTKCNCTWIYFFIRVICDVYLE